MGRNDTYYFGLYNDPKIIAINVESVILKSFYATDLSNHKNAPFQRAVNFWLLVKFKQWKWNVKKYQNKQNAISDSVKSILNIWLRCVLICSLTRNMLLFQFSPFFSLQKFTRHVCQLIFDTLKWLGWLGWLGGCKWWKSTTAMLLWVALLNHMLLVCSKALIYDIWIIKYKLLFSYCLFSLINSTKPQRPLILLLIIIHLYSPNKLTENKT